VRKRQEKGHYTLGGITGGSRITTGVLAVITGSTPVITAALDGITAISGVILSKPDVITAAVYSITPILDRMPPKMYPLPVNSHPV
jgi:hypothetical protein